MAVTLAEVLMGLGGFEAEFDWDPDLATVLGKYCHLRFFWGEDWIFTGVILTPTTGRSGIKVAGRSLEWYLGGANNVGPLVVEGDFLSWHNKLSNGDFHRGGLDLRLQELSLWFLHAGAGIGSSDALGTVAPPAVDDVVEFTESWECRPLERFTATFAVRRNPSSAITPGPGGLRLRTIYEGSFVHPDALGGIGSFELGGWTDQSDDPLSADVVTGQARTGSWCGRLGPTVQRQGIVNGSFEDGLTHWVNFGGTWAPASAGVPEADTPTPLDGTYMARVEAGATNPKYLQYDSLPGGDVDPIFVTPGEEWRLETAIYLHADTQGEAAVSVLLVDAAYPDRNSWIDSGRITSKGNELGWQVDSKDFTIGDTTVALVPSLLVWGMPAGRPFYFDAIRLTRIKGNRAQIVGPFATGLIPQRRYRLEAWVRTGPGWQGGTLAVALDVAGAGRPTLTVEVANTSESTGNAWRLLSGDFQLPSGYSAVAPRVMATDVTGDSWFVDDITLTDTDTATKVYDSASGPAGDYPTWTPGALTTTAPLGAERVRVAVVAEAAGGPWLLDDVGLYKVTTPPWTSGAVVRQLLSVPGHGIAPGNIIGPEGIVYDWRARNLSIRDALAHFSRAGVCDPVREWRVNPDGTLDWGTAAELFADRDQVYRPGDFELVGELDVTTDVEDAATLVRVIGAEVTGPANVRALLIGEAANAIPGAVAADGSPLVRVSLVEDSTVDHRDYAAARARYEADLRGVTRSALRVTLNDWRARGAFNVGDWLRFWDEAAGLVDVANESTLDDGRVVNPLRRRVASRSWQLGGPPFRLEAYNPATGVATEIDSAQVRWSDKTSASLDLGDLLPTFTADPQGGAVGNQFLRFRASSPR